MGVEKPSAGIRHYRKHPVAGLTITLAQAEQERWRRPPRLSCGAPVVTVADANVKLAAAEGTTDPTLGGEYERIGIYNSVGFQISIPLRIFDRNQGEKERTRFRSAVRALSRRSPLATRC